MDPREERTQLDTLDRVAHVRHSAERSISVQSVLLLEKTDAGRNTVTTWRGYSVWNIELPILGL